jgi:hypothetical protein
VLVAASAGQVAPPAPDSLAAVPDADPLELASRCARLGDDAVLQRLSPQTALPERLAAVRATVFLRAPELALPALAELAGSRDPDLAPAAGRRALAIVQALAIEGLARRELSSASLLPVRARLSQLAGAAQLRPDLRALASEAAQLLGTLDVPGAKG